MGERYSGRMEAYTRNSLSQTSGRRLISRVDRSCSNSKSSGSTVSHFKASPRTSPQLISLHSSTSTLCYNHSSPCQTPTYSDPGLERDCSFFSVLSAFIQGGPYRQSLHFSKFHFHLPVAFLTLCLRLDTHYLQIVLLPSVTRLQKLLPTISDLLLPRTPRLGVLHDSCETIACALRNTFAKIIF